MTNDTSSQNDSLVQDYIASLDEQTVKDSLVLIDMMQRISGHQPKKWNVGTIGFDTIITNTTAGARETVMRLAFIQERARLPST